MIDGVQVKADTHTSTVRQASRNTETVPSTYYLDLMLSLTISIQFFNGSGNDDEITLSNKSGTLYIFNRMNTE